MIWYIGELSNVASVLRDLAEEMAAGWLVEAAGLSPMRWSQRLINHGAAHSSRPPYRRSIDRERRYGTEVANTTAGS